MIKKVALVVTGSILLWSSCTNDKEEILYPDSCGILNTSFATVVNPLIQTKCGGCHGTGSTRGPGALTDYDKIKAAATRIRQAVASGFMPPANGPKLSDTERKTITCWIDAGAPNN
jgi:uncharacterized membrane protein